MDKRFIIFLTFFIALYSGLNCYSSDLKFNFSCKDSVKADYLRIIIKYVPMSIKTAMSVDCKDLEGAFPEHIQYMEITDLTQIDTISKLINNLKPDINKAFPDTRIQLVLLGRNRRDILCLGWFRVLFNGEPMMMSDELLTYIRKMIKN